MGLLHLPPYGLCLPCRFANRLDGLRPIVRVVLDEPRGKGVLACSVVLSDVKLPTTPIAISEAAGFLREVLKDSDELSVFLPPPLGFFGTAEKSAPTYRVAGQLFLGTEDSLGAMMIHAGHGESVEAQSRSDDEESESR